jgi:hypothetical protein
LHDVTVPLAINVVYGDDAFVFESTFDLGQMLGPAREYHVLDGMMLAPFVAIVKNGLESGDKSSKGAATVWDVVSLIGETTMLTLVNAHIKPRTMT